MAFAEVIPQREGGKSLCSQATLDRLQREAKQLFAEISEDPPSVGDAIFVEYEHAFCVKHKIGRFGRKTIKDGVTLFHAGPKQVTHPAVYMMDDHNFLDYIKQWREGAYCPPPIDKLLAGPKWPELIVPKKRTKLLSVSYEQNMFKRVGETQNTKITLVNPSFSTMMALKSSIGGYVMLTAASTPSENAWHRDVLDFIKQSKGKLVMLPKGRIEGTAYLGTDVPQWFPPTEPWFRLILSPFIVMNKEFENYSVRFEDDKVVTRYEKKKDYLVSSVLERDSAYFMYNPETVDQLVLGKNQWYFCESSFPLLAEPHCNCKVSHAPWFVSVPKGLPWEKMVCSGRERYLKHQAGILYDVQGEGTYLSRRTRLIPPVGMRWAELSSSGTHWVTYASLRPRRMYGVSVLQNGKDKITLFDDARLIRTLSRVDTVGRVFMENPVDGALNAQLDCDSGLYEVHLTDKLEVDYDARVRDLLITDTGKMFKAKELTNDGVCFLPGGHTYTLPGLGRGKLSPIQTFHTPVADYVVCPPDPGDKFLFPRAGDIEMMCSTLSLFASDWISAAIQVSDGNTDAPLVSTDEASSKIMDAISVVTIKSERDFGVNANQISAHTGFSVAFIYRYLAVTAGFMVWKVEANKMQFTHDQFLDIRTPGIRNDRTADGMTWVQLLRGTGRLRESFLFVNRKLRTLKRFLQWNYCLVSEQDHGDLVELTIRRPKY